MKTFECAFDLSALTQQRAVIRSLNTCFVRYLIQALTAGFSATPEGRYKCRNRHQAHHARNRRMTSHKTLARRKQGASYDPITRYSLRIASIATIAVCRSASLRFSHLRHKSMSKKFKGREVRAVSSKGKADLAVENTVCHLQVGFSSPCLAKLFRE